MVRVAAASAAYWSPLTICSWKSRPPGVVNRAAATPKAMNRARERGMS